MEDGKAVGTRGHVLVKGALRKMLLKSKEVGFSAVAVWTKGGGGFWQKIGWYGMKKQ